MGGACQLLLIVPYLCTGAYAVGRNAELGKKGKIRNK